MLSDGFRSLSERGFAAALTYLPADPITPGKALRGWVGSGHAAAHGEARTLAALRLRRWCPGLPYPQGRVAAPVRAPIARGLRPARACRATLARGPRASASFYPLALDHVLDPIEREGAIDGLGHRLRLDLHGHPAPSSTSAVTTHLDMLTARSGGGAGRGGAARRGSRFRPCRPRTRLWTRRCA